MVEFTFSEDFGRISSCSEKMQQTTNWLTVTETNHSINRTVLGTRPSVLWLLTNEPGCSWCMKTWSTTSWIWKIHAMRTRSEGFSRTCPRMRIGVYCMHHSRWPWTRWGWRRSCTRKNSLEIFGLSRGLSPVIMYVWYGMIKCYQNRAAKK